MRWLSGHKKDVRAVAFAPDGRLVSGGSDRTVRVWSPLSGECLQTIRAPNVVYAVAVSPDGNTLASAGRHKHVSAGANTIALWALDEERARGEHVWQMGGLAHSIWSLAFSADGQYLAAACRKIGNGGCVNGAGAHWWRLPTLLDDADFADTTAYTVAFSPAGTALALTREWAVALFDQPDGNERFSYPLQSSWAAAIAFVSAGKELVIAANSFLHFADATEHRKPWRIKTGARAVTALAVSPDGQLLLAGGRPGTVECYEVASRALRATFDFGVGGVNGVAFAPDGWTFAVAGDKGLVVCDVG